MPASKTKPTPLKRNTVALPNVLGRWYTDTGVTMLEWHCPYCWHRIVGRVLDLPVPGGVVDLYPVSKEPTPTPQPDTNTPEPPTPPPNEHDQLEDLNARLENKTDPTQA